MHIFHKNTKVCFSDIGKGSAVVLLHGFLENSAMWDAIASKLSKKYRVVCIDLLGHGQTENHGYIHAMEDQATMVKAVLNSLKLRKYILVGHSMGGYVGLSFAKLFPNKDAQDFALQCYLTGLAAVQAVCDFPYQKEEENVDFDEFLNGIKTIMLYDNYFEEMEGLFKYLDSKKQGKIKKQLLILI